MATITLTQSLKTKEQRNNDERSLHGENKNSTNYRKLNEGLSSDASNITSESSAPKIPCNITTQPVAKGSGPVKSFNNTDGTQDFNQATIEGGRGSEYSFNNESRNKQSFQGAKIQIRSNHNSDGPTAVESFNNKGKEGTQSFDGATIN